MSSEYQFSGHTRRGEKKFRRRTNQDYRYVTDYLDDLDIPWSPVTNSYGVIYVANDDDEHYMYYPTTGRWCLRLQHHRKVYYSKGIEDFVQNYLNRFVKRDEDETTDAS